MVYTFKRGIHPDEHKETAENISVDVLLPKAGWEMVFPLIQHIGAPCKPLVEKGQKVLLGEKIGDSEAFVCAPVHSSVSGTVTDIRPHLTVNGTIVECVIIENDGEFTEHESIKVRSREEADALTRDELLTIIREAGIVGLGGAGFPTHVKLKPPPDKKIDYILVNGAECEPYLTTDNRVMIEESEQLIMGLQILKKIIPTAKGVIGIEDNKPTAIAAVKKACEGTDIEVAVLKTKYPQGGEKQLIDSITKRQVPSGGLPMDVGCVVQNVDTVVAVHRAVYRGRPLMRKIITLTGNAIQNPGNYKARIGTKLSNLVEIAGGLKSTPEKIVVGGPMMGTAIFDINVPVLKTTSGVIFMDAKEAHIPPERGCIRCGECVAHCPSGLMPTELYSDILNENGEAFVKHNGLDCMECGSCAYVCPAKLRLAQAIRTVRRVELAKLKK